MDILNSASNLKLYDKNWKIYARNSAEPPQFVGSNATTVNSIVSEGTVVDGDIRNSVVSVSCKVGKGSKVYDSILMPDAVIESGAVIKHAIIGWGAKIGKGAVIGEKQDKPENGEWKIAVVGPNIVIAEGEVIPAGAMIGGK
ncbi:MAG: hypothetical protein RSB08_01185 [Clostridia bacterium]